MGPGHSGPTGLARSFYASPGPNSAEGPAEHEETGGCDPAPRDAGRDADATGSDGGGERADESDDDEDGARDPEARSEHGSSRAGQLDPVPGSVPEAEHRREDRDDAGRQLPI